ncbi:response regulator receiver sensor signal transduction histidine kinase [Scytonema sp. HK-05]|uniref:response regulator n=1 Tax=unclassified Scytonema TaxID=2618749 RepID=UPI0009373649|nr:response regulator [Scytonema sp. HK-05]OKH57033.1 response regulator [Scytonema sp. HK-05]BAY49462.1 response regulator receiver sensor signal transduction histidine kinase [Scytonema sp. HK-05]
MQSSERRRILVVDDFALNVSLLQTALEAEGFDVDTATNGNLALAKIEASPPDLVLLDVMMPGMNGYELTRCIRQNDKLPFIPILLVTGCEEASVSKELDIGSNDFIRKPINLDRLLARINACWS